MPVEKALKAILLKQVLLVQLPIPQLNFGKQTGNIPLGGACLKKAADASGDAGVELLPESVATYLGDAQLLDVILSKRPDIIGFTVYTWNVDRTLYIAKELKSRYQPFIVIGGPEVTPDNPRIRSDSVDLAVFGEGEAPFLSLLEGHLPAEIKKDRPNNEKLFLQGENPYPAGLMEPHIENMILVETQRGCPYGCGYCYYGKSRKRVSTVSPTGVLNTLRWAIEQSIPEGYLLDPCLNARRDIHALLTKIAQINATHKIKLISEIRAEKVTETMADDFATAGFNWFEIGLQSINPIALSSMNRSTDLPAFLRGAQYLKDRGIQLSIDLIAGLPGDHPDGFSRSIDFLIENDLADGVQVFPLSVLPGTPFRKQCHELGLVFDPDPPYTIIETPGFSRSQMAQALEIAEDRFDLSLYPSPALNLSGCGSRFVQNEGVHFCQVDVLDRPTFTKVLINQSSEFSWTDEWSTRLAHPYQLFFGPKVSDDRILRDVIRRVTKDNPFTPLEIVFVEPEFRPNPDRLLTEIGLVRPHYLDKNLVLQYPEPGNRSVLFTLLSRTTHLFFQGKMQRQVLWWTAQDLPSLEQMQRIEEYDGIFIPESFDPLHTGSWQEKMAPCCQDFPAISFSDPMLQKSWIRMTQADEYWLDIL